MALLHELFDTPSYTCVIDVFTILEILAFFFTILEIFFLLTKAFFLVCIISLEKLCTKSHNFLNSLQSAVQLYTKSS